MNSHHSDMTATAAVAASTGTGDGQPTAGGVIDRSSVVMAPRRSRAHARRLAALAREQAATLPVLPDDVAAFLAGYRSTGVDDAAWAVIGPAFLAAMQVCATASVDAVKRQSTAVSAYLKFRYRAGLPVDDDTVWTHAGIDHFSLAGMPTMTAATRNDYRSRLLTACSKINPVFAGPTVPTQGHVSVRPGYSAVEEDAIKRAALRQRNPGARRTLCLMVGLAGGAGITGELKELYGRDVTDDPDEGIIVRVPGKRARVVVVRRDYEELVRVGITGVRPNQLLVGRNPERSNVGGRIVRKAELFDDAPQIDARRLRSTWLTWLITQPVPINVILAAAGLQGARSLVELYALLERPDDDAMLRVLRDGGRS